MATNTHNIHQIKLQVETRIKSLVNNDLKEICRNEDLAVSGVKALLQRRILEKLNAYVQSNNVRAVEVLRYRVSHSGQSPPPDSLTSSVPRDATTPISPATNNSMTPSYGRPSSMSHYSQPRPAIPAAARLNFRPSAFYHVKEPLTPLQELTEMPHNRHSVHIPLALSETTCAALRNDDSLKIMLYSAPSPSLGPFATNIDIAFPSQIEVRINGDEVRKSFKGLKNKPGTTKPVDITELIRKAPGYTNTIHVTYALTKERFSIQVNLVKKTSAEQLANQLKQSGSRISKEQVLQEMARKAQDPDIIATSSVMSLKDPISTMRISLPCRSTVCPHMQCFDGSYFLQLQEQAPTWTCPVCNRTLTYAGLCVDNYVQDILQNTSSSTDQVVIEPDGKWKPVAQGEDNNNNHTKTQARAAYDNDSDDDVIEIQDTPKKTDKVEKVKTEGNSGTPAIAQQTPPVSREASTVAPRPSAKRPSAVIDLTLSDDDESSRPAKRTNTSQNTSYNTPASLQDGRYADLANRPSTTLGSGFQLNVGDTLPPIQGPQPNGGLPQGQRLPWPIGAPPAWPAPSFRESQSYSNSPA